MQRLAINFEFEEGYASILRKLKNFSFKVFLAGIFKNNLPLSSHFYTHIRQIRKGS